MNNHHMGPDECYHGLIRMTNRLFSLALRNKSLITYSRNLWFWNIQILRLLWSFVRNQWTAVLGTLLWLPVQHFTISILYYSSPLARTLNWICERVKTGTQLTKKVAHDHLCEKFRDPVIMRPCNSSLKIELWDSGRLGLIDGITPRAMDVGRASLLRSIRPTIFKIPISESLHNFMKEYFFETSTPLLDVEKKPVVAGMVHPLVFPQIWFVRHFGRLVISGTFFH